jgi:signal transduction histidine kinase
VKRLASRLVVLGIAQLVLLAVAAIAIWIAEGPHEEPRPDEHLDHAMMVKLETLIGDPDALAAALEDLHHDRIEVSIYTVDSKQLVASNVDPPLAIPANRMHPPGHDGPPPGHDGPPPGHDGPPPGHDGPPPGLSAPNASLGPLVPPPPDHVRTPHAMVVPIDLGPTLGRGMLVARGVHRAPSAVGPLLTFLCGLVIVIFGALITARWLVRPIAQLSRTATELGAGNLSARTKLDRADEIGELGRSIDDMAERITNLIVSEKELLANVAHELRTPLARIGVALDLANEGDAAAARASIAEIGVDVAELGGIVDDILTAMRFELDDAGRAGGSLPLRRVVTPSRAIADAAIERMHARHPNRPFEATVSDGLPDLDVDPRLFRRVIDNLLENAHKYSPDPDGAIDLTVSPGAAGTVCFEVRDRGIGIPADDLPRVFNAFFRGDRSRSRETGGVGLGLTLAKRLVEAHGGTIAVDSELGVGTTVRVVVPPA